MKDSRYIPPQNFSYEDFPASAASAEGMKTLPLEEGAVSCCIFYQRRYAVRARKEGPAQTLVMHMIFPMEEGKPDKLWPLVVFMQGSAWKKQKLDANLANLSTFARRGYAVVIPEYRTSADAPFPAQVQDAKTAIRFMRKNAERYHIDPDRIALWGDSSGGHTAVMAGLTPDEPLLDTDLYGEYSCKVGAVVDYYGPVDISTMNFAPSVQDHCGADSPEGLLIGGVSVSDHPELVAPTVTSRYVGEDTPPVLMLHGDKDRLVPFEQSILLYEALRKKGREVEFYKLAGADHGGSLFWTDRILDIVDSFLKKHLG